jgi:hypothetical protein
MWYVAVIEDPEKARAVRPDAVAGELWHGDAFTLDCPLGRPNCRHCGDPERVERCRADSHCRDCGRRGGHGVAPDSVLSAKGIALHALPQRPDADEVWDRDMRGFRPA